MEIHPAAINNRPPSDTAFGLINVVAGVDASRPLTDAELEVRFGSVSRTLPGVEALEEYAPGQWRANFHLMTHMFPNGPQALRLALTWPDGVRVEGPPTVLTVANHGPLAAAVAEDLRAHETPAIFGATVDSRMFPYARGSASAVLDRPGVDVPLSMEPAPDSHAAAEHLRRWGFCILPERLPPDLVVQFRKELDAAISDGRLPYRAGTSDRIHNAHRLPAGRQIWLYPPVLKFLEALYGDTPCACQTLTYVHGSQQGPHQDTIHLTPYPVGYMCGVWVALQDVEPDSGELFVYPGSHRTPRLRAADLGLAKVKDDYSSYVVFDRAVNALLEEGGYERVVYRPQAGQILVWHENLVHGGSPRIDRGLKRVSIVSHYFAKGAVGYYDSRGEAASLEALERTA